MMRSQATRVYCKKRSEKENKKEKEKDNEEDEAVMVKKEEGSSGASKRAAGGAKLKDGDKGPILEKETEQSDCPPGCSGLLLLLSR